MRLYSCGSPEVHAPPPPAFPPLRSSTRRQPAAMGAKTKVNVDPRSCLVAPPRAHGQRRRLVLPRQPSLLREPVSLSKPAPSPPRFIHSARSPNPPAHGGGCVERWCCHTQPAWLTFDVAQPDNDAPCVHFGTRPIHDNIVQQAVGAKVSMLSIQCIRRPHRPPLLGPFTIVFRRLNSSKCRESGCDILNAYFVTAFDLHALFTRDTLLQSICISSTY